MVGDLVRGDLGDLDLDLDDLEDAIDEFFDDVICPPPTGAAFLCLTADFFSGGIVCTL